MSGRIKLGRITRDLDDWSEADLLLLRSKIDGILATDNSLDIYETQPYRTGVKHGADYAIAVVQALEQTIGRVQNWIAAISSAAACNNGPDTRTTMNVALGEFVKAMNDLDVLRERFKHEEFIKPDWVVLDEYIPFWLELRQQVKFYLADTKDDAQKELRKFLEYNSDIMKDILQGIRTARGRKKGITPVNQYILDQTAYIQALHRCTRGETFERFMDDLRARPDVQAWQQVKFTDKPSLIDRQSVEVQAFDLLNGLDRSMGAEKLREIQNNEKRRKAGKNYF